MPAFVAPLVGLVLGVVFAWNAADEISVDPAAVLGSRSLVVTTLFSLLVFAPVSAYFMAFEGDWAFAYWLSSQRLPSAVLLALTLIDATIVPLAFVLAARWAQRRKLRKVIMLGGVPTVVALLVLLATSARLSVSASYTQFHGDFGVQPVAGTPLGYSLVWMNGVLAVSIALTVRSIRKISAAARTRRAS